jgi:hypothetical protein
MVKTFNLIGPKEVSFCNALKTAIKNKTIMKLDLNNGKSDSTLITIRTPKEGLKAAKEATSKARFWLINNSIYVILQLTQHTTDTNNYTLTITAAYDIRDDIISYIPLNMNITYPKGNGYLEYISAMSVIGISGSMLVETAKLLAAYFGAKYMDLYDASNITCNDGTNNDHSLSHRMIYTKKSTFYGTHGFRLPGNHASFCKLIDKIHNLKMSTFKEDIVKYINTLTEYKNAGKETKKEKQMGFESIKHTLKRTKLFYDNVLMMTTPLLFKDWILSLSCSGFSIYENFIYSLFRPRSKFLSKSLKLLLTLIMNINTDNRLMINSNAMLQNISCKQSQQQQQQQQQVGGDTEEKRISSQILAITDYLSKSRDIRFKDTVVKLKLVDDNKNKNYIIISIHLVDTDMKGIAIINVNKQTKILNIENITPPEYPFIMEVLFEMFKKLGIKEITSNTVYTVLDYLNLIGKSGIMTPPLYNSISTNIMVKEITEYDNAAQAKDAVIKATNLLCKVDLLKCMETAIEWNNKSTAFVYGNYNMRGQLFYSTVKNSTVKTKKEIHNNLVKCINILKKYSMVELYNTNQLSSLIEILDLILSTLPYMWMVDGKRRTIKNIFQNYSIIMNNFRCLHYVLAV